MQFQWQARVEAANYLLNNKLSVDEARNYADQSISTEDRFENEITKSRALTALGRKEEAGKAYDKAVALGNQSQLHDFARGLQAQGHQAEAMELFRANLQKDPNSWVGHHEAARVAVSNGDFATALKEMELAESESPESLKSQHADLVRRLENQEDINN